MLSSKKRKSLVQLLMMFSVLMPTLAMSQRMGPLRVSSVNPRYLVSAADTTRAVYLGGFHLWGNVQDGSSTYPPAVVSMTNYWNTLSANRNNFVRLWAGWEQAGGLAETSSPWYFEPLPFVRTGPGTANDGRPKFDLDSLNVAYFARVYTYCDSLRRRGIYVAVQLFDGWSNSYPSHGFSAGDPWLYHPYNAANNINGVNGDPNNDGSGLEVHYSPFTGGGGVLAVWNHQWSYVSKLLDTLNTLDNVLYEVCNEAEGSGQYAWQRLVIDSIHAYESRKPLQHVVWHTGDWGIANDSLFAGPADAVAPGAGNNGTTWETTPPDETGRKVVIVDTDHLWGMVSDNEVGWVWKNFCNGNSVTLQDNFCSNPSFPFWPCDDPNWPPMRRAMGIAIGIAAKADLLHMAPRPDKSTTSSYVLFGANPGDVVVYQPSGNATVDLTGITDSVYVTWYDPDDFVSTMAATTAGGAVRTFSPPDSRYQVLYLHTKPFSLLSPRLVLPSNGATGVPSSVTLTWNSSPGATSYRVQVATDQGFLTPFVDQSNLVSTSFTAMNLAPGTTYYWQVSATNGTDASPYSAAFQFATTSGSTGPVASYGFDEGTGGSVADASGHGLTGTISGATWTTSGEYTNALNFNGASSYVDLGNPTALKITGSMTWSAWVKAAANPADDGIIVGKADATFYGWTLKTSPDTGPETFGISIATSGNAYVGRYSKTVRSLGTWYYVAGVYNATAQTLNIYVNGVLDNGVLMGTVPTSMYDANDNVTIGRRGGGFYLNGTIDEVRLYNRALTQSEIQADMTTPVNGVQRPAAPLLLSPANGATGVSSAPTLTWSAVTGATSYHVQVSTSSTFGTTIVDSSNVSSTSITAGNLAANTTYYWHVSATNTGGTSAYSSSFNFTTLAPPAAPVLSSPTNGAVAISLSPTFGWNASTGAASYHLQVATDSAFSGLVIDQNNIALTSFAASGLSTNTLFYWRVNATNSAGSSPYSSLFRFTTTGPPPPPSLSSPSNGSTGVATNVTLSWNSSPGATTYRIQVSTSSTFLTTVVDSANITTTSLTPGNLSGGTQYYWRVNATNASGTSAYSTLFSFTTGIPVPPQPVLASPSNGATGVPTSLTLSWNASSGATSYRVQLSTSSTFSTTVVDTSNITATSLSLSNLAAGTLYYWRANATNSGGTSAYSTSFSFTTVVSPPSSPVLVSPPNGAAGISLAPTLTWNASSGATSYRVQVSINSSFSVVFTDSANITTTSFGLASLSANTSYYWRVSATNAGGTSSYSSIFSFMTLSAPSPPVLASPANGAAGVAANPTLTWNSSAGSTSYRIQIATDSAFSGIVSDQGGLTSTSFAATGLSTSTTYCWHVNATNSAGTSSFSAWFAFTTSASSSIAPVYLDNAPSSPWNDIRSYRVTRTYTNPAPVCAGSSSLRLMYSAWGSLQFAQGTWNAFVNFDPAQYQSLNFALNGGPSGSTLNVRCLNSSGGALMPPVVVSAPANTWQLKSIPFSQLATTTFASIEFAAPVADTCFLDNVGLALAGTLPGSPVLSSPSNGATSVSLTPTLMWNAVTGAASYHVQVSTSSTFATTVMDSANIASTTLSASSLASNTTYYWHVSATNSSGTSSYSSPFSFTTAVAAPLPPVLATPASGTSGVSTTPTLTWNASAGATSYRIQLSASSAFATTVLDSSNIVATSFTSQALSANSQYYWHVSATNGSGTSSYSTTFSFTTAVAVPPSPLLVSPANNGTGVSTSPALTWNASPGAASYRVQISGSSTFATTIADSANITATSVTIANLPTGTLCYWHVSATNSGGTSAYSSSFNFTTVVAAPLPPVLATPTNGSTGTALNPALSWNPSSGASSYRIQVSTSVTFATTIADSSNIAGTSDTVANLIANTLYYWHVCATNDGGTSAYSSTFSFTTLAPPQSPVLVFPANGSSGLGTNLTLLWNPSNGATSYRVQLSTDSGFATTVVDQNSLSVDTLVITGLSGGTTYYWHVNAANNAGSSSYSNAFIFSTATAPSTTPIYIDNALSSPWNDIRSYRVTRTYSNPSPVYAGSSAIRLIYTAWGALVFSQGTWNAFVSQDPSRYQSLDFVMNGGPTGSALNIQCLDAAGHALKSAVVVSAPPNTWQLKSIPFSQLATTTFVSVAFVAPVADTCFLDNIDLTLVPPIILAVQISVPSQQIDVQWKAQSNSSGKAKKQKLERSNRSNDGPIQYIKLKVKVLGWGDLVYKWQRNGVDIVDANGPEYIIQDGDTAGIRCVVSNEVGADTSREVLVSQRTPGTSSTAMDEIPSQYSLQQNYPNPFNPSTIIRYDLPQASPVTLRVFNVVGQLVAVLVHEVQAAGHKSVEWIPAGLASGIYFYRLQAGSFVQTRKLVLMK